MYELMKNKLNRHINEKDEKGDGNDDKDGNGDEPRDGGNGGNTKTKKDEEPSAPKEAQVRITEADSITIGDGTWPTGKQFQNWLNQAIIAIMNASRRPQACLEWIYQCLEYIDKDGKEIEVDKLTSEEIRDKMFAKLENPGKFATVDFKLHVACEKFKEGEFAREW